MKESEKNHLETHLITVTILKCIIILLNSFVLIYNLSLHLFNPTNKSNTQNKIQLKKLLAVTYKHTSNRPLVSLENAHSSQS